MRTSSSYLFRATLLPTTPSRFLEMEGDRIDLPISELPKHGGHGLWVLQDHIEIVGDPAIKMAGGPEARVRIINLLLQIRLIVEGELSLAVKLEMLGTIANDQSTKDVLSRGDLRFTADDLIDRVYPSFLSTIPRLSRPLAAELWNRSLRTPNQLLTASDDELMAIPRLGKGVAARIRDAAKNALTPDCERVELMWRDEN